MPAVSVIVPNYNHARFLRRRVDSILGQTFQDFELILLDDCSRDESRTILREYSSNSRVRLALNNSNSGSTFKQWNKGMRLATGKYAWIAESDDYADERFLERLVQILERDENIAFAFCRSWRVTEHDDLRGYEDQGFRYGSPRGWDADFCLDGQEGCRRCFLFENMVPNASAVVFRKTIYERMGGADESMILCSDWKLWAAMALTGQMAYVSQPLNYYRVHSNSVRGRNFQGTRSISVPESLQVLRWILDRVTLSEAELLKVYKAHAAGWVPELMNTHLPLRTKSAILRHVRAVDPHPMRRVAGPGIETVRRKIMHHWRALLSSVPRVRT